MTGLIYPVPESSPNAPGTTTYVINMPYRRAGWRRLERAIRWLRCDVFGHVEAGPMAAPNYSGQRICKQCLTPFGGPPIRPRPHAPPPEVVARAAEYAAHRRERFDAAIAEATARDLAAAGVQLGGDPVSLNAEVSEASAPAGVVKGDDS